MVKEIHNLTKSSEIGTTEEHDQVDYDDDGKWGIGDLYEHVIHFET
jgi:hypothetical protein